MASRGRRAAGLLALLAATAFASLARADPTAADKETARRMMDEGRALRDRKDLQGALDRFSRADAIMHVPSTGYEVARTQAALGQLVEARDTIARILNTPAAPNEPGPFRAARKHAQELDDSIAGRIAGLKINVTGAPPNVTPNVTVDDVPIPAAALGIERSVNPGHHVIVAKIPGSDARQETDVGEGERRDVSLALPPPTNVPEAAVAAETPAAGAAAPAGKSRTATYLGLTIAGVGVAGVAVGAVTGILTLSKKSSLTNECGSQGHCPPSAWSTLDSAHSMATVSTISFIAGGVLVAAGVTTLIIGVSGKSAPADSAHAEITPWFGPGGAGLSGRYAF